MLETVLIVLTALSLLLHIPAIYNRIRASKTKVDDYVVDTVDAAKNVLQK